MAIGSLDKAGRLAQVGDYARCLLASGYLDQAAAWAEVLEAVRSEERDPEQAAAIAAELLARARAELVAESRNWSATTDVDRLMAAVDDLRTRDVVVLEYVEDHWVARTALEQRAAAGRPPLGVAYFAQSDVWHSVVNGMLEINVWHASTANVAPGDPLLDLVLDVLRAHGIVGHFDEGRIEADVRWQWRSAVDRLLGAPPVGGPGLGR